MRFSLRVIAASIGPMLIGWFYGLRDWQLVLVPVVAFVTLALLAFFRR